MPRRAPKAARRRSRKGRRGRREVRSRQAFIDSCDLDVTEALSFHAREQREQARVDDIGMLGIGRLVCKATIAVLE
jgi:hypothetical protein